MIKKIFLFTLIVSMLIGTSSINIYANNLSSSSEDVKIELIQDGKTVETGYNKLTHTRNYKRSSTRTNGDEIVITAPEGVHYLMVQLDKYCGTPKSTGMAVQEQVEGTVRPIDMSSLEYGETLVYLMNDEFRFVIPGTSGTDANGNTLGGGSWPYDSRAFSTSGNTEKVITARVATQEEINARRNLALNPFDLRGNDNSLSGANKKSDSNVFPHAYANRVTDNKREFEPRNAIDGYEYNASHVSFPYQSWGCGNEEIDSEFSVLFGRYVEIDQIDITLRAQWNPPQPNNANDHDINWSSATLEFSDGTELPITLKKLASPQTIKLPEKKIVSWVRLKDLPISEETIPVDGRRKFSALTEFKVWGKEASYEQATLPSAKNLVNLAQKVNDYWIKTGGNTGNDASNYNHGHSITSEFWAPSVFYTGNMEAYYLTGDENYTDYANRWGSNNIYNGSAWNTKADNSRIGKYFPDNHTSFQTYLDMFSITSDKKFDPNDEKIKNVVSIMNEMEQMDINDLKTEKGYWDRIDFFYMELPNWTKMYLLTGEEKWLDKLRELYDDRKAELYDKETGLFYRDKNYIFDPDAQYDPNGDGNNQKISPNGKKILWSRGNGWAMAALTKVLQDLPDSRQDDRKEYEAVFKKMAATLIEVQGDDGFWRMNLDDYDHDIRPETSGTVFFAYGLTWGINNGLLDKETYYPAVKKAFLGLNANAIRPDGLVGRSELISAYPNPKCSLGIGSSQSYAPAATVMFLSELSKLVEQGYVTDDVEPALDKKMISAVAIKEDSKYAVVNSEIRELVTDTELKTIKKENKIYVPQQFIEEVYGQDIIDKMADKIIYENITYLSMNELSQVTENLKLSSVKNNITVISYKTNLFNSSIDSKLIDLLDIGLTEGKYPKRPEYPIRFDYTKHEDELKPSKDALISVEANTSGAISTNRLIGLSTKDLVNVEFDMVTVLSPSQTNAIVGIGSSDSSYTGYSQVPIIIRMYNDGKIGAYNGKGYVQSNVEFEKNKKYHIRVSINLEEKTYDVYVTPPQQEEIQIATNYAFRSTAKVPENIGKIYLFNNDQQAGKYWLEDIYLGEYLKPSKDALVSVEANTLGAVSASRLIGPSTKDPVNIEFDMVTALAPLQTNAIVGIGSSDSSYTGYSQVPIIIRMYNDGKIGAYNGKGYVQSNVEFEKNKKYHIRVSINLEEKTYDVYVTPPQQEEIQIATNYAFRSTAKVPENIGKIYLFNNDQQAGKYWLEDIYLEAKETDKVALKIALDLANGITDEDLKDVIPVVADEFIAARDEANVVYNDTSATQEKINNAFDRLASAMHMLDFIKGDKTALKAFIDKVSGLEADKYTKDTWAAFETELNEANAVYNDENAMQEEVNTAYSELVTAFLNLRLIPDKSLLEELINQAEGLNSANYTKATFDGLTKALNEAKAVYENLNATQEEVDNAKDVLEKAIAGLQANPSAPSNVDNTEKTSVNNGDITSVKTGDDVNMLGTLGLISSLSVIVFLKKKKISKIK